MSGFDEAQHPRADDGKFTSGGGEAHVHRAEGKARGGKALTSKDHQQRADGHKGAAAARRKAADKEPDLNKRSEHLAQAAHHDARAAHHENEAARKGSEEKGAEIEKHGLKKFAEHHAGHSKDAEHEAHGGKSAHPHEDHEEGGLAEMLEHAHEKLEGVKEKAVEGAEQVAEGDPLKVGAEAVGGLVEHHFGGGAHAVGEFAKKMGGEKKHGEKE